MKRQILLGVVCCVLGSFRLAHAETAVAMVAGTAAGSPLSGTVTLTDTPEGLKISARLTHVPAGVHGFHIHELGGCGDLGKAAGGHFNPSNMPHGMVMKEGAAHVHAGDLGNITAGADEVATLDSLIPGVTLSNGKWTVAGRAIILHEKADDFGQPVGNAGGRIGCGAILITSK